LCALQRLRRRSNVTLHQVFRNDTRAHAETLAAAWPQGSMALLPACFKHCNTESESFSTLATAGVTLEDVVVAWLQQQEEEEKQQQKQHEQHQQEQQQHEQQQQQTVIIEDCYGFNCGHDCPQVPL